MRMEAERPAMKAVVTQASQQGTATGTSMYSKPAASAAATTRSNIAVPAGTTSVPSA